jgi:hypothetical protein
MLPGQAEGGAAEDKASLHRLIVFLMVPSKIVPQIKASTLTLFN